uniref:Uncharacterized protein n=1 Tax=Percolomonas cosmopolitus TaxID=63605 RepID=A0A7S1KNI0_9EUKA|eukprot:CAMPEP_0117436670 /NCGR_PEP_ID=MMETSP0759-20121206/1126_1 /TAXON_ID=63605 /ORGANISM="Percolomonas cosmopolitus, Strain WS" /LENGTH=704 /DNA_ID=CAMNT_0005228275 /DNA_START=13 /DNA_END=2127 /DNA_ORIENTATION=-
MTHTVIKKREVHPTTKKSSRQPTLPSPTINKAIIEQREIPSSLAKSPSASEKDSTPRRSRWSNSGDASQENKKRTRHSLISSQGSPVSQEAGRSLKRIRSSSANEEGSGEPSASKSTTPEGSRTTTKQRQTRTTQEDSSLASALLGNDTHVATAKSSIPSHDDFSDDDLLNEDIGGFVSPPKKSLPKSKQLKQSTLKGKYDDLPDYMRVLFMENEQKNAMNNEYEDIAFSHTEAMKVEKERIKLEEQRMRLEREEEQMKLREQEKTSQKKNHNTISVVEDKFPSEIVLPPLLASSKDKFKLPTYKGNLFTDQEEPVELLNSGGLHNNPGLTDAEILWLIELAVCSAGSQSLEEQKLSVAAFQTLVAPLVVHSSIQCPAFEDLKILIRTVVAIDDFSKPFTTHVVQDNSSGASPQGTQANSNTNTDWRLINSPTDDQLESLRRLMYILRNVIRNNEYQPKEMDCLFYFACTVATYSHGQVIFALIQVMDAFGWAHNNPEKEWVLPSAQDFTAHFPFVDIERKCLHAFIGTMLYTLTQTNNESIEVFASACARAYCTQYVIYLPERLSSTGEVGTTDLIKDIANVSRWLHALSTWMSNRHRSMLEDIEHSEIATRIAAMKVCDELHWTLTFLAIGFMSGKLYISSVDAGSLEADSVAEAMGAVKTTLEKLQNTGNLLPSHPSLVRYTTTLTFVENHWNYFLSGVVD